MLSRKTWALGKDFLLCSGAILFYCHGDFFISNELPFLRIAQKVKALFFTKPSFSQDFNFNYTETKLSFIQIFNIHNFNS